MITPAFRHVSRIGIALLALSAAAPTSEANAQSFPSRTIRIVVPTSASTPPDIISRVIAGELSDHEGWRVVVENRPGAVQTLAAADVLKQSPDGYSILVISLPLLAAPALLPNLGFQLDTDLAPVIKVSVSYNVLVVNPSVPANSVSELVSLLKSKPDQFTFSSGGLEHRRISSAKCSSCRPECAPRTFPINSSRKPSAICSTAPTITCSSPCCR